MFPYLVLYRDYIKQKYLEVKIPIIEKSVVYNGKWPTQKRVVRVSQQFRVVLRSYRIPVDSSLHIPSNRKHKVKK